MSDRLLVIGDVPGFTRDVGRLVSMMNYARSTTLRAVDGLSVAQLDYLLDADANSIGALLLHIAAVEVAYQAATFENRLLSDAELTRWDTALKLGERARTEIRGHDLGYYLDQLTSVREATLAAFGQRSDEWLYEESTFRDNVPVNNYFKWFHVFEDEINHRGQIRWVRKRIPPTS